LDSRDNLGRTELGREGALKKLTLILESTELEDIGWMEILARFLEGKERT
jgi:hypothetical protein